jgi:signal transduction histidine kinase
MARIETGRRKRELADVDVREVARAALDTALPDAAEADVTLEFDCVEPVTMYADRSELEIIFNNLLSNAVKYNRRGGRVEVSLTAYDDSVAIAVSDTGIGLSRDEASRLFHDFVRIRNENTHGIMGSGLGLSIVKKLAALYGGTATVASQPGLGSAFTVTLKRYFVDVRALPEARREQALSA